MAFQGVLTDEQIAQEPQQHLRQWQREHDFAVCIDTDGCTLDNMWAKQVVVFHPHYMDFNGLRAIEMFFRLHAEHHNLWGKTRGCDRYLAVRHTLTSLLEDPEARDVLPADRVRDLLASVEGYVQFVDRSEGQWGFGIPSLRHYHEQNGLDYNITRLLGWSEAVDRTFQFVTLGMSPFDGVRETLADLCEKADILVVSATPYSDLSRWWTRTGLAEYDEMEGIAWAWQKAEHIRLLKEAGGYADDQVIMIGDGGGDLKAARANAAMFYPTPAGKEQEAWANARDAFDAFFAGSYRGALEDEKVAEFENILLEQGPWQQPGYSARDAYLELQDKRIATYKELHPNGKLLTV